MGKEQLSPALFIGVQGEDIISFDRANPIFRHQKPYTKSCRTIEILATALFRE